jgi:hypothetical protein
MTAGVRTAATPEARRPRRGGREGLGYSRVGGVSAGPGAQGTKDGPLGVGPIPVLSEPLGSPISTTVAQDLRPADPWPLALSLTVVHRVA